MAAGENLGASFTIDITDLKAGLAQANRLIRESESEFQAAAAGMDDWSSSANGLKKRVDSLTNQVDIQKQKVAALVQEKQNIIDKMTEEGKSNEEIEKAVDSVNKSIEREGKQLDRLKGKLDKNQKALDEMSESTDDAAESTDDLGDEAKGAKTPLEKLTDTIDEQEKALKDLEDEYANEVLAHGKNSKSAKKLAEQIDSLTDELEDNKKKLDQTKRSTKEVSGGFDGLKTACKVAAGAVAALAAAGAGVVAAFLGLAESTRETRTNMAKLDTAFQSAGLSTEAASDTYREFYGILGDEGQSTEAVAHLAKLVDNERDLATWTDICTGVYATFGDSLPIEGLTEAANETSKTGKVTGNLADALNWAKASSGDWKKALGGNQKALAAFKKATFEGATAEDAFNEALAACSTEQERQELITSTLNVLYSDSADAYRENNAAVIEANKAQADLNDTLAALGAKAEPIMTAVKQGFADILTAVLGLLENVDWDAITQAINDAFAYFVDTIIPAIVDGIQWIIDNKDILIAGIAAVGAAFVAWNVVSLIQGVTSAIKGMSLAQAALNLVMSLNPIGLVVTAIAGLAAAFVVLWNKCEWFRNFWIGLWDAIKSAAIAAWEATSTFFTETIPAFFGTVGTWFSGLVTSIGGWLGQSITNVVEWGTNLVNTGKEKATSFFNNVTESIKKLPGETWTHLSNVVSKVTTWGGNLASKGLEAAQKLGTSVVGKVKTLPNEIWVWLTSAASKVVTWGSNLKSKGLEAAQKLFDSIVDKVGEIPDELLSIGKDIVEGLWNGIDDKVDWIVEKVKGFGDSVLGALKKFFGIASPSRLMADVVGKNLALGIGEGFADNVDNVAKTIQGAAKDLIPDVGVGAPGAAGGLASGKNGERGGVVVYQTNNYAKAHTRYELYKSKKATEAAVRVALGGA